MAPPLIRPARNALAVYRSPGTIGMAHKQKKEAVPQHSLLFCSNADLCLSARDNHGEGKARALQGRQHASGMMRVEGWDG